MIDRESRLPLCEVRQSAGRPLLQDTAGEESPGSMETRCRITSGGGDPRESATESRPPVHGRVRVKGCGKSAPRRRQRGRHGKPHREQDRIGTTWNGNVPGPSLGCRSGWLLEAVGNDRPRGMAVTCGSARVRALQNPAYRPTGESSKKYSATTLPFAGEGAPVSG